MAVYCDHAGRMCSWGEVKREEQDGEWERISYCEAAVMMVALLDFGECNLRRIGEKIISLANQHVALSTL